MTTFSSRSRCGRKRLNRHFRFSWDSTSCPTSSVWGSFYHKSRAVFPTHTEILTVLHNIGYLLLLCRPEALKRSLGNSVWSWCSQTSLYRLTRRSGQHPELWGEKATSLAYLWCLPHAHPHPPIQDVLWCQDTAVLMPKSIFLLLLCS